MEMKDIYKAQRLWLIFVVIVFGIPILQFLSDFLTNPSIYVERKANMKQEYTNINPPENAKKIKESIYNKITRISISTDYTVEMGKEDIEKYYRKEMVNKGWKCKGRDTDGALIFVKGDLRFGIVIDNNRFHISLVYRGSGPVF